LGTVRASPPGSSITFGLAVKELFAHRSRSTGAAVGTWRSYLQRLPGLRLNDFSSHWKKQLCRWRYQVIVVKGRYALFSFPCKAVSTQAVTPKAEHASNSFACSNRAPACGTRHPALPQTQLCSCFPSQKTHEAVPSDCAPAHAATARSLYKQGTRTRCLMRFDTFYLKPVSASANADGLAVR